MRMSAENGGRGKGESQLTIDRPERMLAVILAIDRDAIGLDCLIVGPCNYREADILVAAQDERIKGPDPTSRHVRSMSRCRNAPPRGGENENAINMVLTRLIRRSKRSVLAG